MSKKEKSRNSLGYGFVRLILVKPFIEELKRRGVRFEPTIQALGLDADDINDPTRYVYAETIYQMFDALALAAKDPHLGYQVGSKLDFAEWPPFKTAVGNAKTVGEFLTAFIGAVPSEANSVRHELTVTCEGACYRIIRLIKTQASPQHTEAFGVAVFIRLFQAITGKTWRPEQVLIKSAYCEALPNRVQDVQVSRKMEGGLELLFPTDWLHEPIQLNAALSTQSSARTQFADDVSLLAVFRASACTMLHDLKAGLNEVASAMGVASDLLETALKSEGTTAVKEIRRLRIEAAQTRLIETQDKVSVVAADLGYSDPAHFTRFFHNQTGLSPREYRRRKSAE